MGDPLRERFDITGLKETCSLTGNGAFAGGMYNSFMPTESPKAAVNFEKAGPSTPAGPGGP